MMLEFFLCVFFLFLFWERNKKIKYHYIFVKPKDTCLWFQSLSHIILNSLFFFLTQTEKKPKFPFAVEFVRDVGNHVIFNQIGNDLLNYECELMSNWTKVSELLRLVFRHKTLICFQDHFLIKISLWRLWKELCFINCT